MAERQEHDSEDLVPELEDELKVKLAMAYDQYDLLVKAGERDAANTLVTELVGSQHLAAAHRHMKTLRMRKAAAAKGFRIGV